MFLQKRSACDTMSTNSQEPRVGTLTRLRGGQRRMSGSATGRGKRLFSFSKLSRPISGYTQSPIQYVLRNIFPRVKRQEPQADYSHLIPTLRTSEATPCSPIFLCDMQRYNVIPYLVRVPVPSPHSMTQ
jgi:hypothetical protein